MYSIYIHISGYVRTIFFDISFHFFQYMQDAYVNVNLLYIKFLCNLFLPDVASASMTPFTFVSLVLSLHVILVEDDEANKV